MAKLRLCHRCRERIPEVRLEALPDTWLCIRCSREIGGDYEIRISDENIGKAGSLKKNYGGIKGRNGRLKQGPSSRDG